MATGCSSGNTRSASSFHRLLAGSGDGHWALTSHLQPARCATHPTPPRP